MGSPIVRLFNTGCAVGASRINGCLLTNAISPRAAGPAERGTRKGEACGWNVLMLFAWGDLRITTAMENANITQVSSIDTSAFMVIPGFYGISKYCTVVSGY